MSFRYTVQNPTLYRSRTITGEMIGQFRSGASWTTFMIIYTRMANAMQVETDTVKLLPLHKADFLPKETLNALADVYQEGMVFYPSTHSVMANIVPNYINGMIYGCLVESYCSEHNSRMHGDAECDRQCHKRCWMS